MSKNLDKSTYGIMEQRVVETDLDKAEEELMYLGYTVIESGYSKEEISEYSHIFDTVYRNYIELYKKDFLNEIDEYDGIRLPLVFNKIFIDLAMNPRVLGLVKKIICNKFILNQQNGIINPPGEKYTQGLWHRDLPYQHFVTSRPLAISALYCVDNFTVENGATFVLPTSHSQEEFPSDSFVKSKAVQITAPAGSFLVLNSMVFHRGGMNRSSSRRRAVNHVFTSAFIKQQIDIPSAMTNQPVLSPDVAEILGYRYQIPRNISEYFEFRRRQAGLS